MNIAELAIRNGTVTWTLSVAILILGWLAFDKLPRLEDPALPGRVARVVTPYPGASAAEVEREVSGKIEQAVQALGQLERVESDATRGLSVVSVVVQDRNDRQELPPIWVELRRRIADLQPRLPPGAGPSVVEDDLGEVYGYYYALTGEGFTHAELKRTAELVQRELASIDGISKTTLFGERQETVFVEISKAMTRSLGIGLVDVFDALGDKNLPADAGHIRVGPQQVPIYPSGIYRSEEDFGELLIAGSDDRLIRLDSIADIRRGYQDPPRRLLQLDGRPAIGIAASISSSANAVAVGDTAERMLAGLTARIPLGMELQVIALQSAAVGDTIDGFIVMLLEAAALIMIALLVFMGLRGGLIVVFAALLTMAATFVVMNRFQIALDRISMGTLIIALGLVTDNAILVLHRMKLRMDHGMAGMQAAREVTSQDAARLLAVTAVTLLAFAAIWGMDNSTGEYTRALSLVLLIALPLSWVSAVTAVPLLADRFLKRAHPGVKGKTPSGGRLRRLYAGLVAAAIRRRWTALSTTALLFAASVYGFGYVKQVFFPPSAAPSFLAEVYFREGTRIGETARQMDEIQSYLHAQQGVTQVVTAVGDGHPRSLPFNDGGPDVGDHYGASLVFVDDHPRVDTIRRKAQADLSQRFPDAVVNLKRYPYGTQTAGGRIQLRISGPEPAELRRLADWVKRVMEKDPDTKAVRDDWGAKVKVAHPVLAQDRARRMRVDRTQISNALRTTYSGTVTGYFREGHRLIPIVARAPEEERNEVEDMADITVTSPLRGDKVPMLQLVDRLDTRTEDARRSRRDRRSTITVHADAGLGLTSELLERIKPRVEKLLDADIAAHQRRDPGPDFEIDAGTIPMVEDDMIPLKGRPDYYIAWGGEAESAAASRADLGSSFPFYFGLMALIVVALFNALRQPLTILLMVPLSLIGITAGLLLTGRPFGFMSLLGVMGLSGILIRNAFVLVDGIDREITGDKARLDDVVRSGSGHLRPIALIAGTSILAMIPLLQDELFENMAVTVTCGLGVATLLTLTLVPVLYAVLFRIGDDETG